MSEKCKVCGTAGFFTNSVWKCPVCDLVMCAECIEKRKDQRRGGFMGMGEMLKCPKCSYEMKKIQW